MPQNTWDKNTLAQMRQLGDPLADDILTAIVAEQGQADARQLFDLLIRRLETPIDELPDLTKDYINQTSQLAEDIDMNRVANAQALFLDHGPKMLILLQSLLLKLRAESILL